MGFFAFFVLCVLLFSCFVVGFVCLWGVGYSLICLFTYLLVCICCLFIFKKKFRLFVVVVVFGFLLFHLFCFVLFFCVFFCCCVFLFCLFGFFICSCLLLCFLFVCCFSCVFLLLLLFLCYLTLELETQARSLSAGPPTQASVSSIKRFTVIFK